MGWFEWKMQNMHISCKLPTGKIGQPSRPHSQIKSWNRAHG